LYNYVNKPEKTKEKVYFILDNFYKNDPDGLIGNEDCGQMSAWYVLSSMGIYNVTPGKGNWSVVMPSFEKIMIHFENNSKVEVTSNNYYDVLNYVDLQNVKRRQVEIYPKLHPVPVIQAESKSFLEKTHVFFDSQYKEVELFYSLNGSDFKMANSNSISLDKTTEIKLYTQNGYGHKSNPISATFFKKPNNFTIDIKSTYNPQYHAGGPEGLIDGIFGTENWRKGDWQGYQTHDFEAIIDMQSTREINQITANFLQDTRSWILMPTKVEYYISDDNVNFTLFDTQNNTIDPKDYNSITKGFKSVKKPVKARYVKIKATNFGKLPEWHQGFPFDGEAFIFVDEITVE
jgi:hypothetical protein